MKGAKNDQELLLAGKRDQLVKKSILISLILKGGSILFSLLLVRLTLSYLDNYVYGVWLTLSSILLWLDFFDIGLGNGLRNRLAESMATNDTHISKIYVSTTFFLQIIIILGVYIIGLFVGKHIDWYSFFNVHQNASINLNASLLIVFTFICISFFFKCVSNVYLAFQLTFVPSLIAFLGQLITFIWLLALYKFYDSKLESAALAFSASPVIVAIVAFIYTFIYRYRFLLPNLKSFKFQYVKDLFTLGISFFLLQIGGLLIYTTSNIIISRTLSPEEVTPYNIAYKYFSLTYMIFSIIITPMWSASTEAFVRGDFIWINKMYKKMKYAFYLLSLSIIMLIIISNYIYKIWVGSSVSISIDLSILMGIYNILLMYSTLYSTFLSGMGILKVQVINTLICGCLFIPTAIILTQYLGIIGICLALSLLTIPGIVCNKIQFSNSMPKNK